MSKTVFSTKCEILGYLWLNYREEAKEDQGWTEFFAYADIALPLAYMKWQNLATINKKEDGERFINEAWDVFCQMINIDPEGKYASISDCFDASPNPELERYDDEEEGVEA